MNTSRTAPERGPVYAVVGATDLAVEKVREVGAKAAAVREELAAGSLPGKAAAQVSKAAEQAQHVPSLALRGTMGLAGKAQTSYDRLVHRGEALVNRLREQQATKDLLASAGSTVARSKGAVTTVRKAAAETQRAAKATLTTGRHQAKQVASTVGDAVADDAAVIAGSARSGRAATAVSARRTGTTARTRAARSTAAAKGAATSARKTATRARKVANESAEKVGD
ncbi:MAG TPA: hypothetical protein VFJ97_13070 [Dermatophilaceae bacterium]|nr:hypothetical protein [Dermatophilaceae bacterium]